MILFALDIHLVKEGQTLSRDSRSSEKFIHGIKVLMAQNYIDNLSEEARKGMIEKAEQGIWPSYAPLGYKNVEGIHGKKIIVPDLELAPLVKRLFILCAEGTRSIKELAKQIGNEGLNRGGSRTPMPTATAHKILRQPIYMGEFEWAGKMYKGSHEPLVPRDLWEHGQKRPRPPPRQAGKEDQPRFRVLQPRQLRPLRLRSARRTPRGKARSGLYCRAAATRAR